MVEMSQMPIIWGLKPEMKSSQSPLPVMWVNLLYNPNKVPVVSLL